VVAQSRCLGWAEEVIVQVLRSEVQRGKGVKVQRRFRGDAEQVQRLCSYADVQRQR